MEVKHRVYGHVARVHRALLTHSLLYTAGEDGRVAVWNTDTGQLLDCQQPQVGFNFSFDVEDLSAANIAFGNILRPKTVS